MQFLGLACGGALAIRFALSPLFGPAPPVGVKPTQNATNGIMASPPVGNYAYDHATKVRTPKPERASQQRSVAEHNGLTPELLRERVGEWLPPDAAIPNP